MTPPATPRQLPLQHPEATALGALPDGVGLAVGQTAPDAALTDSEGAPVSLRDLIAKGPVMLIFYRGGWCPFCNTQIHALTEAYPEFERRGVTPVAVSVDSIDEGAKSRAAFKIPFPVLSDSALGAHRAFNVLNVIADEELARLKSFGIDLEASSKQTHHTIAIPSVFVIDKLGVIRWAHAETDYKKRPSVEQLLSAIDAALK
jgi:peroxiredoxin